MKLSVIIVNYNVRYFLEQCLISVYKAIENIEAEVFVVDNISTDNSVEMVKEKFPKVRLIANKENVGFSKANNQAIELSKGEYVLLLNPDTVVEEDAFEKCIDFMDKHPEGGGLGVKMIDGNGIFLPESKRGLPTPSVSFYKIFGFSTLFPKSKRFAKYHLGYLKENETNEIEVLSGAYMWMRKSVLEEVGYLDESFFMYGEDIDLSYRITLAGYKNYYLPETKIIHYKGESTKKGSINYVFVFYNAMIIFSKKHFAKKAKAFAFFINIAIYLRAFLALIFRFFNFAKLPIIDFGIIFFSLFILNYAKPYMGFPNQIEVDTNHGMLHYFAVIISFLLGVFVLRGYTKTVQIFKTITGVVVGGGLLFGINFFFPIEHKFSTKYLGSLLLVNLLLIYFSRIVLNYFNTVKIKKGTPKTLAIVGGEDFISKIKNKKKVFSNLLKVKPNNTIVKEDYAKFIGKQDHLPDLVEIYNVNEVVFSADDISYKDIIHQMDKSKSEYTDFKITLNNDLLIGGKIIENLI